MSTEDSFDIVLANLREEMPATLFHYTTQRGLLGIIQSKSIWASDLRYLNDKDEYLYGLRIIQDAIVAELGSLGDRTEGFLEELEFMRDSFAPAAYVACLSALDDDLSQWRAYSGGGGGACLGFRTDQLAVRASHAGYVLLRVRYNRAEQESIALEVARKVAMQVRAQPENERRLLFQNYSSLVSVRP